MEENKNIRIPKFLLIADIIMVSLASIGFEAAGASKRAVFLTLVSAVVLIIIYLARKPEWLIYSFGYDTLLSIVNLIFLRKELGIIEPIELEIFMVLFNLFGIYVAYKYTGEKNSSFRYIMFGLEIIMLLYQFIFIESANPVFIDLISYAFTGFRAWKFYEYMFDSYEN